MSPSRSLPRILFVLLVILLGSTQLYGQSLSASPSQVVAGSTQSVTVTWSCAAGDSGCAPNWNQFAFPVYFGGNGSLTLYPGWVNCGGDPPNPPSCQPYVTSFNLSTGGQQFTQTVAITPNQITITAAPTQFASGSQIITVQGSLSAPLYQQRTACPFVYTQGAPGTSLLNIDYSVWTCVNIPAG